MDWRMPCRDADHMRVYSVSGLSWFIPVYTWGDDLWRNLWMTPPTHTLSPHMEIEFSGTPPWRYCKATVLWSWCKDGGWGGGLGGNDDSSWSSVWLSPFPMQGNFFFGFAHVQETSPVCQQYSPLFFLKKRRQMSLIPFQPSPLFLSLISPVSITNLLWTWSTSREWLDRDGPLIHCPECR